MTYASHGGALPLTAAPSIPLKPTYYPYAQVPMAYRAFTLPAQPVYYGRNSNGTPVNFKDGPVTTESCGIHIRRLSYEITQSELEQYLRSPDPFETCELKIDSTGKSRGYAVVIYASEEAARYAVEQFDGKVWNGKKIVVKLDTNTRAVGRSRTAAEASLVIVRSP